MSYLNLKPVDFDKLSAKAQAKITWKGRFLLPKYDGCMALVGFWDGKPDFILSRDGKACTSMDHVYDALLETYPMLKHGPGGYCFIGEAWTCGKEFADISGMFRRKRNQPELGYSPFDIVQYKVENDLPILYSSLEYRERLLSLVDNAKVRYKVGIPIPVVCEGYEHAEKYAQCLKAMGGYDGAVASDPFATYAPGSGSAGEFLKVKPLLSFSLEVVGYESAVGEKTGRATGALVVRFKGVTCKVATGLSEAEQADLAQFVGKIIEVQCMGVYPGETGLMREPRYCGMRDDVLKADY